MTEASGRLLSTWPLAQSAVSSQQLIGRCAPIGKVLEVVRAAHEDTSHTVQPLQSSRRAATLRSNAQAVQPQVDRSGRKPSGQCGGGQRGRASEPVGDLRRIGRQGEKETVDVAHGAPRQQQQRAALVALASPRGRVAARAMASHALSESRPSCLRPRQRILCLHSFRTSGAILKQQLFLFSNLGKYIRVAM